jgi:hypothetical protein
LVNEVIVLGYLKKRAGCIISGFFNATIHQDMVAAGQEKNKPIVALNWQI